MAERGLLAWGLAGFHASFLVATLVTGLYLAGAAGDLLAGLDTRVGLALYGYLWAATWWTNRRWLAAVDLVDDRTGAVLRAATRWGAVTGLLLFVGPLAVASAFVVSGGGLGAIPFVLLGGVVGAILAAAVGALVGGLFAALDLLLLRASVVVVPDGA